MRALCLAKRTQNGFNTSVSISIEGRNQGVLLGVETLVYETLNRGFIFWKIDTLS